MKKWIAGAAMALIMVGGQVAADAHGDFPERPIMLMVSYGAGGAT